VRSYDEPGNGKVQDMVTPSWRPGQKRVAVILVAGASLGSSNLDAEVDDDWRPPLAVNLFGARAYQGGYWELLQRYSGAQAIQDLMFQESKKPGFAFETALRRFAEHSVYKQLFKHVPAYLRDLLHTVERQWARSQPHYTELVAQLLVESDHHVAFISLNYDTFLEQAIAKVLPELKIFGQDDYARAGRVAWVLKVHGSIDWSTPIGNMAQDWDDAIDSVTFPDILKQPIDVGKAIGHRIADYQDPDNLRRVYPILTAPLAGKGDSEFLLPADQKTALAEFLEGCHKYLILGTSGKDDDLLGFLSQHAAKPTVINYVASGDESEVGEIRHRFRSKITQFRGRDRDSELFFNGFGGYIQNGDLKRFSLACPLFHTETF